MTSSSPPLLDIILVNYNSTDHLLACLKSIFRSLGEVPARVMVEDNASEDEADRIQEAFPEVALYRNRTNLGFSRAVNKALRASRSPYVLILNPDTVVEPGFFPPILEFMASHPDVGITGPAVINEDGSVQGSARAYPNLLTAVFGRSSLLSRWFPGNPVTSQNLLTFQSDGRTPMEVDWVSGACMLARRAAVQDVGLLDQRFFMYWEDADWCRRFREKGWRVVYFPRVSIIHYVGVSSTKNPFRSALEFHKSSYRLFEKYAPRAALPFKPLVIGGLSLRILPILVSGGIQAFSGRRVPSAPQREDSTPREGRIKVLRMIARLNIGGPAIHVHLLSKGLDGNRFASTLVSGRIPAHEGDMGYLFDAGDRRPVILPYLQRDISLAADIRALFRIYRILKHRRPDIVHSHTAKAGFNARLAVVFYNWVNGNRIKVVHTFHGHVFHGYFSPLKSGLFVRIERLLARATDIVVAISGTQKRELAEKYRIAPAQKIRVIPLGFDLGPFLNCGKRRGEFRRFLGVDAETLLIGIVGRLVPIKNHRMFLDAAKRFVENNSGVPVCFVVVGDGELREELEAYGSALGLGDHTHFSGWVQDAPLIYADLDVLALTSRNEGTPVSIIEAMAASVPVVATDAGGVQDLLGRPSGVSLSKGGIVTERGVLCGKEDSAAFAEGFEYLTGMDREGRSRLVGRARTYVTAAFSQERLVQDIEALYTELTCGKIRREREGNAFGYPRETRVGHRGGRPYRLPCGGRAPQGGRA